MKERSLLNFFIHVFPLNRDTGPFGALSLHMDLTTASHGFTGRFLWSQCRSITSVQLLLGAVPPPVQTLWTDLQQPGLDVQSLGQETFSRCISEHVN